MINDIRAVYLSDFGRCRDNKRLWTKGAVVPNNDLPSLKIKNTNDVVGLVEYEDTNKMCILAHPDRWNDSFGGWLYEFVTKKSGIS